MPIFSRKRSGGLDEFIAIVRSVVVLEDTMTQVQLYGRKIILMRHAGHLYAIDSLCPHAAADLSQGSLHRWKLCCHEHDYCFDVRSGRIIWPEDEVYRLRRYETREENGMILVRLVQDHKNGERETD